MSSPICVDLDERLQYIQQAINYYQDHIRYNEDRINYLIFVGVNRISRRPYIEHLSIVQQLHQSYTTQLLQVEHIRNNHQCYHSL